MMLAGLLVLLMFDNGGACPPDINPQTVELPEVVVHHADPLVINCTALFNRRLGDACVITDEDTSLFVGNMTNVDWDIQAYCNITMNESLLRKNVTITVYKTPDSVSISPLNHSGPMVEGTEYHLLCDIKNVAPLQNLVVKWYKGNESILNVTYSDLSIKTPGDVFPNLTITPSRDDDGAQYRCEAELDLGPEGPQPPPKMISKDQIHVEVLPHQPTFPTSPTTAGSMDTIQSTVKPGCCYLEFNPPSVVVEYGDPVSVLCSTSHPKPDGMGWESTIGGVSFQPDVSSVTWTVDKLEDWTIEPMCYHSTVDGQPRKTLSVIVYKTPDSVSISPLNHAGPMVEGTEYHLVCDIKNVAPLQNLVVKWYKGNESILNVTYSHLSIKTPGDVFPNLTITPSRDDDAAQYRCEAELDLGPEGPQPPPTVTSEPLNITVHYEPRIVCPGWYSELENDLILDNVRCIITGNPPPDTVWSRNGEQVNASVPLSRTDSGLYTVSAINDQGSANATIQIIVEYAPELTCRDEYNIVENENVDITALCKVNGRPEPDIHWFKDQNQVDPPIKWTRKNNGEYKAISNNTHGKASHIVVINVFYAPEILLKNRTSLMVIAGSNVSLDCSAEGNPSPEVKWNYTVAGNINVTTEGRQRTVRITRALSANTGIYTCTATNRVGMVTRKTTVTITTEDYLKIIGIICLLVFCLLIVIAVYFCKRMKKQGSYHFNPINTNINMRALP
ncbi:hypothetical protein DPEC_G00279690 [Dallia pectoralis]|uniref:Uncharacterized protein n=1 Tax=Dallia pectoralis TaxID=75939 RepID=A0ACC2FMR6_DALPE|nr:hypothetical protein DPEC_G00279690 [Dallia pectoralis]